MGKALIVIVILGLIVLFFFGQYVSVRNTLVTKNEAVKAAWSQVDIVLQRRADLIPNLVETVKGYAKQEQTRPARLCSRQEVHKKRLPLTANWTVRSAACSWS